MRDPQSEEFFLVMENTAHEEVKTKLSALIQKKRHLLLTLDEKGFSILDRAISVRQPEDLLFFKVTSVLKNIRELKQPAPTAIVTRQEIVNQAFILACHYNHYDSHQKIIEYLLKDEKADVNIFIEKGPSEIDLFFGTALGKAIDQGNEPLVALLLRYNAVLQPNIGGELALSQAIRKGNNSIIQMLLAKIKGEKTSLNQKNLDTGLYELSSLRSSRHVDIHLLQSLLDAGANTQADIIVESSLLKNMITSDSEDSIQIINVLSPYLTSFSGFSAFCNAVVCKKLATLQHLITTFKPKKLQDFKDNKDYSAIMSSVYYQEALNIALLKASQMKNSEIVGSLLAAGADEHYQNKAGASMHIQITDSKYTCSRKENLIPNIFEELEYKFEFPSDYQNKKFLACCEAVKNNDFYLFAKCIIALDISKKLTAQEQNYLYILVLDSNSSKMLDYFLNNISKYSDCTLPSYSDVAYILCQAKKIDFAYHWLFHNGTPKPIEVTPLLSFIVYFPGRFTKHFFDYLIENGAAITETKFPVNPLDICTHNDESELLRPILKQLQNQIPEFKNREAYLIKTVEIAAKRKLPMVIYEIFNHEPDLFQNRELMAELIAAGYSDIVEVFIRCGTHPKSLKSDFLGYIIELASKKTFDLSPRRFANLFQTVRNFQEYLKLFYLSRFVVIIENQNSEVRPTPDTDILAFFIMSIPLISDLDIKAVKDLGSRLKTLFPVSQKALINTLEVALNANLKSVKARVTQLEIIQDQLPEKDCRKFLQELVIRKNPWPLGVLAHAAAAIQVDCWRDIDTDPGLFKYYLDFLPLFNDSTEIKLTDLQTLLNRTLLFDKELVIKRYYKWGEDPNQRVCTYSKDSEIPDLMSRPRTLDNSEENKEEKLRYYFHRIDSITDCILIRAFIAGIPLFNVITDQLFLNLLMDILDSAWWRISCYGIIPPQVSSFFIDDKSPELETSTHSIQTNNPMKDIYPIIQAYLYGEQSQGYDQPFWMRNDINLWNQLSLKLAHQLINLNEEKSTIISESIVISSNSQSLLGASSGCNSASTSSLSLTKVYESQSLLH